MAADLELLKLAMPEARIVTGVSVDQIRMSPLGQFLLARFTPESERELQGMIAATGFDPRKHLDGILMAAPGGVGDQRRLILATGTFDPSKVIAFAQTMGAEVAPHRGIEVVTPKPNRRRAGTEAPALPRFAFAFLSPSLAVGGDPDSVRGAIDRRLGGGLAVLDPKLSAGIDHLNRTLDAWFVSLVPLSEFAGSVPDENVGGALKGDVLKAVNRASGGVKFGANVEISADVVARSAQDATSLADVLRFLAGMALLGPPRPQGPDFRALLGSLDLKAEGDTVRIALAVPETELENLILSGGRRRSGAGGL
jgi:hypothetical protein